MNKNKVNGLLLAALIIGPFGMISGSDDAKANEVKLVQTQPSHVSPERERSAIVNIDGTNYDISEINNLALIKRVLEVQADINNDVANPEEVKELKELLDMYFTDPKLVEHLPITLDLGPAQLMAEEIMKIIEEIEEFKKEIEALRLTKMAQQAIDEQVAILEDEILQLKHIIGEFVRTFDGEFFLKDEENAIPGTGIPVDNKGTADKGEVTPSKVVPANKVEVGQVVLGNIFTSLDNKHVFRIEVLSNGTHKITGAAPEQLEELVKILEENIEFENNKAFNLSKEIAALKMTKMSQEEINKRVNELKLQMNSVKVYGMISEVVLLNLEKDSVMRSRLIEEEQKARIGELNNEINNKVASIKDYMNNGKQNPEYVVTNTEIGKNPTINGYILEGKDGFIAKVNLNSSYEISVVDMEVISEENKVKIKTLAQEMITENANKIVELEKQRAELEKNNNDIKYYLVDGINKRIQLLEQINSNLQQAIAKI